MATSKAITGGWRLKLSLKAIDLSDRLSWREALVLLGIGAVAVVLYSLFHWPMKMPGRHGLEWMALLLFARTTHHYRWAAAVTAFGAAMTSQVPIAGVHEPWAALSYLLPGLVVDLFYQSHKNWRRYVLYLAVIAAFAHATRPLLHYVEALYLGVSHGSLAGGLSYPLLTHLGFGFVGGLTGALLAGLSQQRGIR